MIIRPNGATQLLITQPDHAELAARIMRRWRNNGFPHASDRSAILLAIEAHDNGWCEVDVSPLVDRATGRILDFVEAPDPIKRDVWPRGVARLAAAPHAAALVAQHALHIYRRHRDQPDWADFFADMEAARDHHLRRAAMTLEDVRRAYFFLRIGDLTSLTFCNGWTEVQSDDSGSGVTIRLSGARVIVTPDPFEGEEIPFEVPARELPNRVFGSAAEALAAYSRAGQVKVRGVAAGG